MSSSAPIASTRRNHSRDADVVIHQARYDGLGRRVRRVVTNSGEHDGTAVYYYAAVAAGVSADRIIETRDGSGNVLM